MQKDNEIRTLRAQQKQKEMILKRKQEEVSAQTTRNDRLELIRHARCISFDDKCVRLACVKRRKKCGRISVPFSKA